MDAREPRDAIGAPAIRDYGLIGDGRSAALVSRTGSIDWLCWPRFDSPSLFGAVLDPDRAGRWSIAPSQIVESSRRYLRDTNVLVTELTSPSGRVRLVDFFAVASEPTKRSLLMAEHELYRLVECVEGTVELDVVFEPRPDYARRVLPLRHRGTLGIRIEDGPRLYTLQSDAPLRCEGASARARLRLRAGQRLTFVLSFDSDGPAVLAVPSAQSAPALARTVAWWRRWAARCTYGGPYRDAVVRSVLCLKLLSFAPSGAIIAAPTTSLPERLGGDLNWDYRFCWLRDAALTVRALLDLGYEEDAHAFVGFLLHSTRLTRPKLNILYDVFGEVPSRELQLPHLRGHRGARPVRIQNAAASQIQLDTYGEVIDAVAQLVRRGRTLDRETQRMIRQFGEYVCKHWEVPDQGIWEPRGPPQHFTHSKVLCWAALERCLELHRRGALHGIPADRFEHNRALLRDRIEREAWNPRLHSYTQTLGGETVDASLLLLSWYGFAPAHTPRMRATARRIHERLEVAPGLLVRNEESFACGEGAFGICSFWAVEYRCRSGEPAHRVAQSFEQLLGYANDLGLFAEELDPASGEPLGNFPQAFTHVGLIGAALALEEREKHDRSFPASGRGSLEEARP